MVNLSCPVLTRTLLTNGAFSINSFATVKNVNKDEFLAATFLINDEHGKSTEKRKSTINLTANLEKIHGVGKTKLSIK